MSEPNFNPEALNADTILDTLNEPDDIKAEDKLDDEKTDDKLGEEESDKTDDSKGKEDKEEEEESEDDDIKDIEEELDEETKDEDKDELEFMAPVRRKEILAKYPNLFKEFPYLEYAYYRSKKYTDIFGTINEAREAKEAIGAFQNFERDLSDGNTEKLLSVIKQSNPKAFDKIVDSYLDTLGKVDQRAVQHITGNIVKYVVNAMAKEGSKQGKEALKAAATLVNDYVFGTEEIQPPSKLTKEEDDRPNPKEEELKKREHELVVQHYQRVSNELGSKVERKLKNIIEQNIDPKESMTDYIRTRASKDVQEQFVDVVNKDKSFTALLSRCWDEAYKKNFDSDSLNRIERLYTNKAKSVLPTLINKARREALKGLGRKVQDDKEETENRTPLPKGSPRNPKTPELKRGMKTLDYFMQDS